MDFLQTFVPKRPLGKSTAGTNWLTETPVDKYSISNHLYVARNWNKMSIHSQKGERSEDTTSFTEQWLHWSVNRANSSFSHCYCVSVRQQEDIQEKA